MRLVRLAAAIGLAVALGACARGQSYELQGQIVAVDAARQELTIKHGDIKGFMPGMTMAFKVKDGALMAGRTAGDLVRARLVIEESRGYLTSIDVTGHAPLTEPPPARSGFDLLAPGEPAPDVPLLDQDGRERRFADWRGRVLAVTFVYTRCPLPDFCPLMDRHFAAVQRTLDAEPALRDRVHLLSITIDPEFDTPAVLKAHAERAGARPEVWSYATGNREELTRFGARFGVAVMRDDPSAAEVIHNLRTAVIDRDGRLTTIFPGNEWSAADLTKEIRRAAGVN